MDADCQSGLQIVAGQLHDCIGNAHSADGDVPLANAKALIQHCMGSQGGGQVQQGLPHSHEDCSSNQSINQSCLKNAEAAAAKKMTQKGMMSALKSGGQIQHGFTNAHEHCSNNPTLSHA